MITNDHSPATVGSDEPFQDARFGCVARSEEMPGRPFVEADIPPGRVGCVLHE